MKTTAYLLLFFPQLIFAQLTTGKLIDEQNQAIKNSSVEVEIPSLEPIVLETDENGQFSFELNQAKSFSIYIKEFGYQEFEEVYQTDNLKPFTITLKKDESIQLKDVIVSGQKPLLKRKIDRIEFNVENTPLQNLSAWDIVKNTPNVILKNDQLSVRGNTQILVTINDKKTLMTQDELKQLLENTDGSTVSSVEVITNPPAKYEASGSAIINIKMKKNVLSGYKGQVAARYHQSIYSKGMLGTSQSYNTDKWQLTGSYYFVNGKYVRKNFDVTTYEQDKSRWESDMIRRTVAKEQHVYNFASQYTIDSLQNLQFGLNGYRNPASIGNYNVPTNIYNIDNNQLESYYVTQNHRRESSNSFNSYLVYDKKFGNNNLTWSNNFSHRYYKEKQDVLTQLNFNDKPYEENRFLNNALQKLNLYSTQIDYTFTNKYFGLETGTKYSFVKNDNDLDFFESIQNTIEYQPDKSNVFNYKEQIFALYISSNYKWKKWEAKAGLRSETTWINTISDNPITKNKRTNTGFFPTFYLMYSFENAGQIGLNYGKRIDRPDYNFLNPSKSYYNMFSYFQGDANAISTIIHNLSLSYTLKDWNFETYYRYEKDPAMEISIQNPETFETVYHFTNIKNGEAFGANLSKNFNLKSWWKLNLFAMGEYNENYYFGPDQKQYKNDVFFYHLSLSTQLDLDRAKTFNLSAGYRYNSKAIQGSFNISSSQNTYVILNKKLWDKRFEIGLTFNDIFKTDRGTISTKYADQNQYFKDYRDTQYFILNLKYNFGNQKVKDAKQIEKTSEQNRI
ncbi:outer membrane beta-barrel family protein [Empedobacter brevis]|uniref:outer membrane beta-barrel family protein n=1 Tax=Empedobacter brevis TaxID=247 RepID=UPI0028965CEB|nr:outer membrane beta-barrel family protein [Empedobacter brevis]